LKISAKAAHTRSQKLQRHKSSTRVQTSDAISTRNELNKLQREISPGLINLEEVSYRSTTTTGDFKIRQTPLHHDNPRKVSCSVRFGTMSTSATTIQAPLVETMLSDDTTPQKGVQQLFEFTTRGNDIVNADTSSKSDDSTTSDLTSRYGTPSTTIPGAMALRVTSTASTALMNSLRGLKPQQDEAADIAQRNVTVPHESTTIAKPPHLAPTRSKERGSRIITYPCSSRTKESKIDKILDFKHSSALVWQVSGQCKTHSDVQGSRTPTLVVEEVQLASHRMQFDKNLFERINNSYNDVPPQGLSKCRVKTTLPLEGDTSDIKTLEFEPLSRKTPHSVTTSVTSESSNHKPTTGMGPKPNHTA
jgi:hypothetical protein